MFLMKASVKTNGLNAYVSGLGATKRIVVWDTTAGRVPDDEVMFVFGHESGHYVLHHIPKMLIAVRPSAVLPVLGVCAVCGLAGARALASAGDSRSCPGGAIAPLATARALWCCCSRSRSRALS